MEERKGTAAALLICADGQSVAPLTAATKAAQNPPLDVSNTSQFRDLATSSSRIFGWGSRAGPQAQFNRVVITQAQLTQRWQSSLRLHAILCVIVRGRRMLLPGRTTAAMIRQFVLLMMDHFSCLRIGDCLTIAVFFLIYHAQFSVERIKPWVRIPPLPFPS